MLRNIFGTNDNASEVSSSSKRKSKRRDGDEDEDPQISRRSRGDSTGTSSTSKRKSSRRESTEQSSGFHPTSTAFSSTSRSPYADVAAPSVAASYATAYTAPSDTPIQRPEVVRNESMAKEASRSEMSSGSRRDSKRDSRGNMSRSIDGDDERRNAGRSDTSRRDSRRKSSRKDTATRAAEDHDNSLPQNQFPGQEPAGFGVASPYRPPGLATDYYGDHGESIAEQPGVRLDRPSILISADQAHLLEPTVDARPPAEPSSLGHVGAAADFFGGDLVAEPTTNTMPSRPVRKSSDRPGRRPSLKPGRDSTAGGASPRSSPGPDPRRRPLPQSQNSSGIGAMGAGAAPLAIGAMASGVGAAADYYTGNIAITPHDQPLPSGVPGRPEEIIPGTGRPYPPSTAGNQSQSYYTATENVQTTTSTTTTSSRPPQPSKPSGSNVPLYGAAAAAAGIAGAAYLAHEHTSAQHEQAFSQSPTDYQGRPSDMPFRPGQNQSQSFGQQQQQMRRRRTGAFGKFVDWFQDPAAVAEYEAYTEAIGVCKYCFEPGTTPAQAPRKHNYRRRRPSSGSRYGSSTRVDKLARYSSDENLRRRNSKKGYSTTEKVLATGLAGVGAAAVANEVYKRKNDFDDTYSVKSGKPDNRSRVSFQETEEERYSTSKRKSDRDSEGLSRRESDRRRQSRSGGEVRYEKRSSRRRDSSSPEDRNTSRGGNLSTPVALAGAAAVGAALTSSGSRRRSRSRSKSPKRNRKDYYSKRVSPKHSYVDLNQTLEDAPSGPLGLGGFFSSPSYNSKRGKKKKGLFNFSNNSSSSSDADLVFGAGTVRRKDNRGRRDDRKEERRQSGIGDTAAILGLAATGAVLAAETSRRDDKGKRIESRKTDSNRYDDDESRRPRREEGRESTNKIKLQGYHGPAANDDDGVWEDASDNDDESSVDMGLAYGGRLSSRASKESLNEGTNILGWRFGGNQKKKEEEKRVRRKSSKTELSGFDPVKTGLVAGAGGVAGAAAAQYYARPGSVAVESPPKDMPPLRYLDPVPVDSFEQIPKKQSMQSNFSPKSSPVLVMRASEASLEHPQPVTPISKDVYQGRPSYSVAPSGPVVFDKPGRDSRGQDTGIIAAAAGTAAAISAIAAGNKHAERERHRDDRVPAMKEAAAPSLRESVSFDLTKEQEDREQRRERKRREKEARRATEAASASRDSTPQASIITGPERSPERKLETWRLRDAVKAGRSGSMEPPLRDPSPQSVTRDTSSVQAQPLATPERETRLSEIDRQLEELYAQHREQEVRKKKEIEAAGLVGAAVAVGAGVIAATSDSGSQGREKPRRKSSMRKSSRYRDQDVETESGVSVRSAPSASASDPGVETASERLARKAARRVQNQRAPSPVHQHDDYTTFFVPPELKDRMEEHNREAEANIVDIVPGIRRAETFPDELYHVYGTEDTDVPPAKLHWKVPMLELVSPTPPPRSPSIAAEKSPVILATSGTKDIGEPEVEYVDPKDVEPRRSNSKVTWGDHEINVYEVITPEYERDGHDFTVSSPEVSAKKEASSSPLRQAFSADDVEKSEKNDMDQPVPPVEKMTPEQREHVAMGKDFADLPPSRDITRDMPEPAPPAEEKKPSSIASTPAMQFEQFNPAGSTMSGGSFYQSPFASTVSDLDLPATTTTKSTADGSGSVTRGIVESPKEELSEERISKSERRRRERAEASVQAEKVMSETNTHDMAEPHVPGGFSDTASDVNVFDFMVTTNGSELPSASVLGTAATSVLASDVGRSRGQEKSATPTTRDLPESAEQDFAKPSRAETFDEAAFVDSFTKPARTETFDESAFVDSFADPKRADTFDEAALVDSFATPQRAETFAEGDFSSPREKNMTSDPEDWEKTSSSSSKKKSKSSSRSRDDDYYSSSKKKLKRDSQIFNASDPGADDDAKSTTSAPAGSSRSKTKRKSSSSRQYKEDDEDTRSVVSDTRSAASDPTGGSRRKGKEKEKETSKKSGWALLGGLIGASAASKSDVSNRSDPRKSDVSSKSGSKKSSESGSEKKRRSSKSGDSRRSRSASLSSSAAPLPADEKDTDDNVDASVDEAFVSADENGTNGLGRLDTRDEDERDTKMGEAAEESFLAERPEMPTTRSMASESVTETGPENGASGLPVQAASESVVATETPTTLLGPALITESPDIPTAEHMVEKETLTTDTDTADTADTAEITDTSAVNPIVDREAYSSLTEPASALEPADISTTETAAEKEPQTSVPDAAPTIAPELADLSTVESVVDTEAPTSLSESASPSEPVDFSTPRQRRLSNLRTTDLNLTPSPTISSSARGFGRFPVSPGIMRPSSIGSPPTTTAAVSASSPLTTPRTRQGRPNSTDFRSGKEFRPLYLVERHSATKAPTAEEEETYPSLPSSRTSSAHPSLENLRGQYSDGEVDVVTQMQSQPRQPARRYSWGHSNARTSSPEFWDSGDVTPTQETFPTEVDEGAGGKKEKEKTKPKYEFHSPSELLQDPNQHHDDIPETTDTVGSPLPSAIGTEGSLSPTEESGRRSRSRASSGKARDHDLGLGLGFGAGLVGAAAVLAADHATKASGDDETGRTEIIESNVDVTDSKSTDKDKGFTLQPVTGKKGKKGKKAKKKGKTVDLGEDEDKGIAPEPEPAPDPEPEPVPDPVPEPVPEIVPEAVAAAATPETKETVNDRATGTRGLDRDGHGVEAEPIAGPGEEAAAEVHQVQEMMGPDKTEIMDPVLGDREVTTSTEVPTPTDMTESEAAPEAEAEEEWAVPTPSKKSKKAKKDKKGGSKRKDSLPLLPTTDAGLESTSSDKNLEDLPLQRNLGQVEPLSAEPTTAIAIGDPNTSATRSLVSEPLDTTDSTAHLDEKANKNSFPFDATSTAVSAEDQEHITSFQPSNSAFEAAFEAASAARGLPEGVSKEVAMDVLAAPAPAPVPVAPTIQPVDIAEIPEQENEKNPFGDDYEIPSSASRELHVPGSFGDDFEVAPDDSVPVKNRVEVLPAIMESEPEGVSSDSAAHASQNASMPETAEVSEASKDIEQTEVEKGTPSEQVDEFAWAPSAKKSKKDKKGKKKNKVVDDFDASTSETTGAQTPAIGEPAAEEERDLVAPQTAAEVDSDLVLQPVVEKNDMDPVAEAEQIVREAQEVSTMETSKGVEAEHPAESEGAAEDEFAWAPTKKSKKDKKAKKKSRTVEDFESESQDTGLQTPVIEEARNIQAEVAQEEPGQAIVETGADANVTEESLRELAGDEWAFLNKTGKKGKKSKGEEKLTVLSSDVLEPESQQSGAAIVPKVSVDDETSRDVQESVHVADEYREPAAVEEPRVVVGEVQTVEEAEPVEEVQPLEEVQVSEEAQPINELQAAEELQAVEESKPVEEAVEDEWAVPVKKSKKDKKSKKKSAVFDDADTESPATGSQTPADEGNREIQETSALVETVQGEPKTVEEPVEAEWATTKKSKKDKKSKKKSAVFDDFGTELPATASQTPADEADQEKSLEAQETAPIVVDAEPLSLVEEPESVEQPVEAEWAPTKRSKKDKKSKRKSTVVDDIEADSPATGAQTPAENESRDVQMTMPTTENLDQIVVAEPEPVTEPVEQLIEDEWATPVKKSKNGKKSKKSAVFDELESESPAAGSQTPTKEVAPVVEEVGQPSQADEPKIVEEPVEPPTEQLVEDEWAAPAKTSKKGKKPKKSGVQDEFESESPVTGSQTPAIEESQQVEETNEETHPVQDIVPVPEEPEKVALGEESKTGEEPIEEQWAVPTKKSKKDKKSKRKTLDLDSAEPTERSTPASEARDVEQEQSSNSLAASIAGLAAGALAGITGVSIFGGSKDKPAEDEESAATSGKKSKKDKKSKKKGKAFSLADDEESAPATDTPEPDLDVPQILAEEQGSAKEGPATINEIEHAANTEKLRPEAETEPEVSVNTDREAPAEEDEWAVPIKKSKKDKKGKKKANIALLGEDKPTEETSQQYQEAQGEVFDQPSQAITEETSTSGPAPAHVDDVTNHYFGMLKDYQPAPDAPDNKAAQLSRDVAQDTIALAEKAPEIDGTERDHPTEVVQSHGGTDRDAPAMLPSEPAHDFPVMPEVAHVDDVVDFHYGLLKDYIPDSPAIQESREVAEQIIPSASDSIEPEGSALSTSNPAHDFPVVSDVAHVDDVIAFHYDMLKDYKPDSDKIERSKEISEQILPVSAETAAAFVDADPVEDAWTAPVKKSKKDKKKKRQTINEESSLDTESTLPGASQKDFAKDTVITTEPREMTEQDAALVNLPTETDPAGTTEIVEPAQVNEEDLFPVVTKKSKKDKKKKRQSTFDDFGEISTEQSKDVSEADVALPVAAGVGVAAVGTSLLASSQDAGADEASAVENPAVEEDFISSSSKKSKKDKKKKRQSTFDDFADEQSAPLAPPAPEEPEDATVTAVAVLPAGDVADTVMRSEETRDLVKAPTEAEEQSFEFSTKKSKKDKKKKRESTFDDFADEQTASPALEEPENVTTDAVVPSDDIADTVLQSEEMRDPIEAPVEAEEQPLEFSTKKSKKDKKKKRVSAFEDFETAPNTSIDDLGVPPPVVYSETILKSSRDVTGTVAPAEDETFITSAKKGKKDKKMKRQSAIGDVEMEEPATVQMEEGPSSDRIVEIEEASEIRELEKPVSEPQEPVLGDDGWPIEQAATQAAPIDEEEWAVPAKKSKKDKKKKTILSLADEENSASQPTLPITPAEFSEARDLQMDVPAPDNEMAIKPDAQPAIVPDSMPIVVAQPLDGDGGSVKDYGQRSKSIPDGWDKGEENPVVDGFVDREPVQLVDEVVEDVERPGGQEFGTGQEDDVQNEEEDLGYVVKKNKKEKKGKKGKKSEAFPEEPESQELEAGQIAAVPQANERTGIENTSGEVTKEVMPEDEWGFTSKKSKKDKKSKKSKNIVDDDFASPEKLAIPETSQESSGRDAGVDESAVPTKKSKKDKKLKRQSSRDVAEEAQPEESLAFPVNDPAHIDDVTSHYHAMLRDYRPAEGAPDNKPMATSSETVQEASIPHVDDVTGHYYGMLREYQPAEGAADNKPAVALSKAEEADTVERVPSPVSDEETRRARRARRKASPVYRGEEPEDMPGYRSLTPPADHNDMINTALGVAAGLGLTGASASAASSRTDTSEAGSLNNLPSSTAQAPSWSFAKLTAPGDVHQVQRDSGVQFADSPTLPHEQFDAHNRDSGYVKSPANRDSWPEEVSRDNVVLSTSDRPPRPQSPTSSSEDVSSKRSKRVSRDMEESFHRREPSPVLSTSKERSSKLFNSSPSNRIDEIGETTSLDTAHLSQPVTDIHRSPSIHGHHRSRGELRARSPAGSEPTQLSDTPHEQSTPPEPHRSIFGPYSTQDGHERGFSPPKTPLHTISEHSQDASPSLRRQRDVSDVGEGHPRKALQHQESGRSLRDAAGIAGVAAVGAFGAHELSRDDDQPAIHAKSLGRSKPNTKSSRSLRRATFDPEIVPSSSAHDPFEGKGKEVAREMSDIYDGHGEYPGSPRSPTRPPSMRKRQSMQQIKDLETRLDQLATENRNLAEAKILAERHLEDIQLDQHKTGYAAQEALDTANFQLREKDEAIAKLQQELEGIRQDHARLLEVNTGLSDAHESLRTEHDKRYSQLEDLHAETQQNWQESSRELETLRGQHADLSGGMEDIVQHQIDTAVAEKDVEIERLRAQLEMAKVKITELEQQIMSGGGDDILDFKDEDYFENACQSLCQHVQQWVLRFSKFSDTLVCRTTHQIRDEKLVDRFDLAILDGSDVDVYLGDRIKRRDVFMSVVMTMIFEYVFTRYLFGMDRDQRQTLKKLEKNLSEVGPLGAVHQWRAMTLTLLSKRQAFKASRENDTEAVVLQVYDTLAKFLPPPQHLQAQVVESLRNVMRTAVDLSIEMRTQKAEYIMLPPLQPEYDTNGDLTRKVYFNASLMNERSGETTSNDELEAQHAVVRMVLFPLVVKKGNDDGEGEEEIVVCPAQVLVARPDRKSKANSGRVVSAQSDRMSVDQMSRANVSRHSLAPSPMDMSNVI